MNSTHISAVTGIQPSGIEDHTPKQAFSLRSACPRQIAWQARPGAVLSCLLGQGLASRLGQEAGAPPSPGKMRSLILTGYLGILPCWRNWFQGPDSLFHLLEGFWGLEVLLLSVFSQSSLPFSPLGKSTCYLCISWPFTKLIKP